MSAVESLSRDGKVLLLLAIVSRTCVFIFYFRTPIISVFIFYCFLFFSFYFSTILLYFCLLAFCGFIILHAFISLDVL